MTTITLHYQSPPKDPFKVPRPHRVTLDDNGEVDPVIKGGEVGPVTALLGFSRTLRLAFSDSKEWHHPEELYDGDILADDLKGWHPAFMSPRGPFTVREKIDRIEIT